MEKVITQALYLLHGMLGNRGSSNQICKLFAIKFKDFCRGLSNKRMEGDSARDCKHKSRFLQLQVFPIKFFLQEFYLQKQLRSFSKQKR